MSILEIALVALVWTIIGAAVLAFICGCFALNRRMDRAPRRGGYLR
jgi:hypothetical protein